MGIEERVKYIFSQQGTYEEKEYLIKRLVIDVLNEVLESGHDLGGVGEYGNGWNDRGIQTKMVLKEMIERWKNEE